MPSTNYFKIGVFTLVGMAILLAGLFLVGFISSWFKENLECVTYFNRSVQGLSVDSAVKFRGFQVGKVTSISLASVDDPGGQPVVRVGFEIEPKSLAGREEHMVQAKDYIIRQTDNGMKAFLTFQGITGMAFLDLDYSEEEKSEYFETIRDRAATHGHVYIPSGQGQIMEISESATRIVKSLSDVDFAGISRDVKTLVQAVDVAVTDLDTAQLSSDISEALAEVKEAGNQLAALAKNIDETVKGGSNTNLGRELESSVTQLRQTLKRFDQLLGSSQGNLPLTLDNLRVMSENFRELSELLKAQPSQAIFGQPPRASNPTAGGR